MCIGMAAIGKEDAKEFRIWRTNVSTARPFIAFYIWFWKLPTSLPVYVCVTCRLVRWLPGTPLPGICVLMEFSLLNCGWDHTANDQSTAEEMGVTFKSRSQDTDFCPASLFSLFPSCACLPWGSQLFWAALRRGPTAGCWPHPLRKYDPPPNRLWRNESCHQPPEWARKQIHLQLNLMTTSGLANTDGSSVRAGEPSWAAPRRLTHRNYERIICYHAKDN